MALGIAVAMIGAAAVGQTTHTDVPIDLSAPPFEMDPLEHRQRLDLIASAMDLPSRMRVAD